VLNVGNAVALRILLEGREIGGESSNDAHSAGAYWNSRGCDGPGVPACAHDDGGPSPKNSLSSGTGSTLLAFIHWRTARGSTPGPGVGRVSSPNAFDDRRI